MSNRPCMNFGGSLGPEIEVEHVVLMDADYYEVPFAFVAGQQMIAPYQRPIGSGLGVMMCTHHTPIHVGNENGGKVIVAHKEDLCLEEPELKELPEE